MTEQQKIDQLNEQAEDREGLVVPESKEQEGRRGCTDPLAANFDPLATIDNGQCYYLASSQSSG